MGSGTLPKVIDPRCIHKCKIKLGHAKKKLNINMIQKCCCLLWP